MADDIVRRIFLTLFLKKEGEYTMSEITKEIQEYKEVSVSDEVKAPEITPKSEMNLKQANSIYEKITDDVFSVNNEAEQMSESIENEDVFNEIYDCDIDGFSFDNLDFEDERLEGIIKYFEADTWQKLDIDDKRAVIQAFETYLVKALDLKRPPRVIFYYGPQGDCGAYNRANNTIKINMNMIDNPKMAISTIAHETWHAYQYQCAENPQTRKDALYAINFINYIRPVMVDGKWVMFEEYESQLVEAEANAFGRLFEEKVGGK